ncbi:MAG TPA: type 2 lanthipeptide synthetase LanM family protein [Candidatus Acidoferrum sp.]|jgi:type 2 lantibiotic biosynthesis protein LanM|nr:type 2 lanthipeptide synthetase LanM family protein [Candidatus Acidoferrum sp.]
MGLDWEWHQASTLAERGGRYRGAVTDSAASGPVTERGRKRLAKWKAQAPFDSGALFQQRLEQAGLTESELLELLSEPPIGSPAALAEPPAWATEVADAFADSTDSNLSFGSHGSRDPSQIRLLELVRPLIERAVTRLRGGIGSLTASDSAVPFEPNELEGMLVSLIPNRLLPLLLRTVVLELNVARVRGLLAGATREERFASFIARIQRPEIRLEFFREYPVLGRQIATALEQWLDCSLEFLQRWRADWPAIRDQFAAGADPGPLARIEGDAGDRHRGGRTVWILECRSGLKVVYKPRPMAVDQHFQEVLGWLNDRGVSPPYRQLKVLDGGAYGWEEFVAPKCCCSREEVVRFYERAGGYVALLYLLAATDFHHENVLAAGEHPVLVDLEALFHASALEPELQQASDIAGQSFGESVLGSGLLPVPIWSGRDAEAFDLSGLGADAGQKLRGRSPGWEDVGTDEMHFARRQEVIASSSHRATLNGTATDPLEHLEAMERGFQQVYQVLEKRRQELLAPGGILDRFAGDDVRVVLRNTSSYGELLAEGSHPDVLRDAVDRDRLFDRLWQDVKERPLLAQVIPAEIEDLWRGDVPLFTTQPGSRDLWAGVHRRFDGALNESGLDCARRRLGQFGSEDLKRQLWFLRGSVTTLASRTRAVARGRRPHSLEPGLAAGRKELLAAACAVGDRLVETAFRGATDITWIGLTLMREKNWVLVPLGMDFYDGVPGIGFFLAYLGAISGDERYTVLARASLDALRHKLRPDQRQKGLGELGGFNGWGGVLYTLAHLGTLWGEPALLAEAQEMAEVLPGRIEKDRDLDFVGGAAGCIAGLLCLQKCRPSPRLLQFATECGDHLLAHAQSMPQGLAWRSAFPCYGPLTGFSHGAAGISWSLLELAARTGEHRFKKAAVGGIAYERSLFSAEAGNWPDLRVLEAAPRQGAAQPPPFQIGWCHGAPGIGLARLLCRHHLKDPVLDTETEVALRTTLANGFGSNHCLCHGDLGNLEPFLEAARAWPESRWSKEAERLAAGILNAISLEGWLCGNPLAVESPGLMTGLAGIGYGLLRCAEPARVPSILSLAPPIPASAGAPSEP